MKTKQATQTIRLIGINFSRKRSFVRITITIQITTHIYTNQYNTYSQVMGADAARPSVSFVHFGFDQHLLSVIRKSEYTKPTSIQAQAVPIAMSGRDVIGIAKTGRYSNRF